jgi:hypothetical protein
VGKAHPGGTPDGAGVALAQVRRDELLPDRYKRSTTDGLCGPARGHFPVFVFSGQFPFAVLTAISTDTTHYQ